MSGHPRETGMPPGALAEGQTFIQKPVAPKVLLKSVAEALAPVGHRVPREPFAADR